MSDTPETDAEWDKYIRHPYTHGAGDLRILLQRLERERDEANEELHKQLVRYDQLFVEAEQIRIERDEARESLKHITEYGTEEINAAVELRQKLAQALVDLDNMQDQRDPAMKVIKRLEQERDEARGERDKLQVMRKEVVAANKGAKINAQVSNSLAGKLNQAERERDEAREVFWEMWQSGDAFLPYIDQETITRWRKSVGWEETK
jgi:uncharacterized coiled-coil DUF342 family protein